MEYSERYKADLVSALHNVDTETVQRVVECLKQARSRNRRMFVCGSDHGGSAGAQFLADTLKQAKPHRGQRLRVLNLNAQITPLSTTELADERVRDRLIVEELKTFAEPGDVVLGISGGHAAGSVLNALEYASWINCQTVAITGSDDTRIPAVASIVLKVSATHIATLDDAVIAVCHLIGHSFVDSCASEALPRKAADAGA